MKYTLYIESVLNPLTRITLVVIVWFVGGGVYAVLAGYVFAIALCCVLAFLALRRCVPADLAAYEPHFERKELLRYTYPLLGITVLTFLIRYTDSLFLAHYRSASEVGMYSVALRVITITGFALNVVSKIFAPIISELHHRQDTVQLGAYLKVVTLWAVEIFVPMLLLFTVAPRQVLGMFGNEFRAAWVCLIILAIGQMANIITGPVGLVLNMAGWTRLQLWNSIAVLVLQIVMSLLLVRRFGFIGAAVANGAAVFVVNLARIVQVRRHLHIHPFSVSLLKPFFAASIALLAGIPMFRISGPIGHFRLVALGASMLFTYLGMLIAIGLDDHSRIAWHQLRDGLKMRLLPTPLGIYLRKEA